jgi:4-aminobutyrate aminotransferase-like enzyme
MGDVHPHARKAELARKLSEITFERWSAGTGKTIFTNSGFEAVEAALKTALLATGQAGVIAFEGGYHGLGYGALNATHREHFRAPFRRQLSEFAAFAPFPQSETDVSAAIKKVSTYLKKGTFGAVLVEPVQARGGIRIPPVTFLKELRAVCDRFGALLIVDEIYTGFGRTGRWFGCEHAGVIPDLICLGKALTGGFPLSACVGKAELMDKAWPPSTGEAIHTSTYLGHPVGCAMALANIAEIERTGLVKQSEKMGAVLLDELRQRKIEARGLGLMAGVERRDEDGAADTNRVLKLIKSLLAKGYIFLPEGAEANVIAFTPPLTISVRQIRQSVGALAAELRNL